MEEPNSPIPNNATIHSSSSSTTNNIDNNNNALTKTISTSTTNSVSTPSIITNNILPENCPIASEKENQYFHALFKSVPENDRLIEIYKCALHREILLQGHLYISEHHICFHANIFGWITNLVIEYSEIVLIERRMTAMIIPNGIQIDTHHAKHTFASFIYREAAYQRLVSLWESHQKPTSSSILSEDDEDDDDDWSVTSGEDDDNDSITSSSSNYNENLKLKSLKHQLHHHHHHDQNEYSIPLIGPILNKWKGIILCFLFLHSAFLMKQWFHLERQLQNHHQLQQRHHQHYYYNYPSSRKSSSSSSQDDNLSLSDFLTHSSSSNDDDLSSSSSSSSSSSPLKMNHEDHQQLYQRLDQLRLKMDGLNQQIIDQQLHLYDLSLNIKQNME